MKTNSINNKGCSVCEQRQEKYTTFHPAHRPKETFYQYDYRHTDGELFSTVAPTLEECRSRRNEWLKEKSKGKYILLLGFQRLGEFETISEAKKYAQDSGLTGVFNLIGIIIGMRGMCRIIKRNRRTGDFARYFFHDFLNDGEKK